LDDVNHAFLGADEITAFVPESLQNATIDNRPAAGLIKIPHVSFIVPANFSGCEGHG
jgi:hypothetical protein